MNDRILIGLAPGWALGFDSLQWILFKADKEGLEAEKSTPADRWRGKAFIATTKAVLWRCIHENGIQPTPEAAEYIDAMPGSFRVWYRRHRLRVVPEEREAA